MGRGGYFTGVAWGKSGCPAVVVGRIFNVVVGERDGSLAEMVGGKGG